MALACFSSFCKKYSCCYCIDAIYFLLVLAVCITVCTVYIVWIEERCLPQRKSAYAWKTVEHRTDESAYIRALYAYVRCMYVKNSAIRLSCRVQTRLRCCTRNRAIAKWNFGQYWARSVTLETRFQPTFGTRNFSVKRSVFVLRFIFHKILIGREIGRKYLPKIKQMQWMPIAIKRLSSDYWKEEKSIWTFYSA